MQQIKYASTAWNDIKNSPGWKGKVALLALLQIIPIFGQIVLFGYIYGWARDIAWGVHAPLPAKIFSNEDGKLYSRGFFILVILFVFSLVPGVVMNIASVLFAGGIGYGAYVEYYAPSTITAMGTGGLLALLSGVLLVGVMLFWGIAAMRTAIYDRISAGFQLKKLWAMFHHDSNGVLRILGMAVLIGVILGLVISLVAFLLVALIVAATVPGLMFIDSSADFAEYFGVFGPSLFIIFLIMLGIGFVSSMGSVVIAMMVARASGYWTQQFQVAQWRGQDDPMPFEVAQMQQPSIHQQPPVSPGV